MSSTSGKVGLWLWLVAGCGSPDEKVDADGDGFPASATGDEQEDCDDASATVNPGATEICDGRDNDCDGDVDADDSDVALTLWYLDADEDGYGDPESQIADCEDPGGYVEEGEDCDDGDPEIHPGAEESCDGVDQDCDGVADDEVEGAETWFRDSDEDGFGDPTEAMRSCEEPEGYVDNDEDCDDADPNISPAGTESCDEQDEDCDGDIDEDVDDAPSWYLDADGDGYGDPAEVALGCSAPTGYTDNEEDCDDTQPEVSPVASEVCNGMDDDCDTLVDDADEDLDLSSTSTWYRDADEDGYGDELDAAQRCEPEAGYLDEAGDCDDARAEVSPDAEELCATGDLEDCDLEEDVARLTCILDAEGTEGANVARVGASVDLMLGGALAAAGDVDGDGFEDVLVGAPDSSAGVYLLGGPLTLGSEALSDTTYTARWTGGSSDQLGRGLAGGEDLDGDDYHDVVFGAPYKDYSGASNAGAVSVAFGPVSGAESASDADVVARGGSASQRTGSSVSTGDVDGDGSADLLVGAPGYTSGSLSEAGAVFVLLGPLTAGSLTVSSAYDLRLTGSEASDLAGTATAAVGDVDGDGSADLLVGAPYNNDGGSKAGLAGLVLGPAGDGALLDVVDLVFRGSAGDEAGTTLTGAGDVDDDGYADLLIGAPAYGTDRGRVSLLLGAEYPPLSADVDDADAVLVGASVGDALGSALSSGFDVDGDGLGDLVLGAPGSDEGGSGSGALWLVSGLSEGTLTLGDGEGVVIYGGATSEALGSAAAGVGDTDGDGWSDLAIGAPGYVAGGSADAGAVFVFTTWY